MAFVILQMLRPIWSMIFWLFSVQTLVKIWSAISWLVSVQNEIEGVEDEIASMDAFLEEAEDIAERAKIKRMWIRKVKGLAYDLEDCLDEFKRRLVHPTDQEIAGLFLRTGALLRTWAGTCFRKINTRILVTSPGTRFHGVGTPFHGISNGASFLRAGVELGAPLLRTGVVLGIHLLKTGTRLLRMVHAYFWVLRDIVRIKASVREASNTAQRFGFISTPSNAVAAAVASGSLSRQLNACFIQDDALVGIDGPMDELLNLLLDGNKAQTCVISVVGCGGLGKTTLVRKVFESQRLFEGGRGRFGHFTCRAWLIVSASFQPMGFLKQVFIELSLDGFNQELRPDQLIQKIRDRLQDKRYIIVFDDIWTLDSWEAIKYVFPVNNKGSRIIVTTRDENVARTCCVQDPQHVYKLPTLSAAQSMGLLCKIVFKGHPCPNQLKVLSEEILNKCGGVPLVIATIGGVLASKPSQGCQ